MDVFAQVVSGSRQFLREAALAAAHELGLFSALSTPQSFSDLAKKLALRSHRLVALVDVLILEGLIERVDTQLICRQPPPYIPPPIQAGWGLLSEVIRSDRPLEDHSSRESQQRFHQHLRQAGAEAAAELAAWLRKRIPASQPAPRMLDAGSGAGVYSSAFLRAIPDGQATLLDRKEVLTFATQALTEEGFIDRAQLVPGELLDKSLSVSPSEVVLLANVLHLLGPDDCATVIANLARFLRPDGFLVIKDLRAESEVGILFALNMALYTQVGMVHPTSAIVGWCERAGLVDIKIEKLEAAPDSFLIVARPSATP